MYVNCSTIVFCDVLSIGYLITDALHCRLKSGLHYAVEMGHIDVLELLVKHGAKVTTLYSMQPS